MDIRTLCKETLRMPVSYKADNNLISTVETDFYNLNDGETLLVVGTEIEGNEGPSITNSIEAFAKKVRQLFPTFKNYQFIESYRWQGEPITYDIIRFIEEDFETPTWSRLTDGELESLAVKINQSVTQLGVQYEASAKRKNLQA